MKLTLFSILLKGIRYSGFVMSPDGKHITLEQAYAVCPPLRSCLRGTTYSVG